jgi:hypothetical protein
VKLLVIIVSSLSDFSSPLFRPLFFFLFFLVSTQIASQLLFGFRTVDKVSTGVGVLSQVMKAVSVLNSIVVPNTMIFADAPL